MGSEFYSRFEDKELILRDELALDRTLLANERTLLAYLRSAVALFIAGVSIMNFSTKEWFKFIGIICIPLSVVIGIIGVVRYRRMSRAIAGIRQRALRVSHQSSDDLERQGIGG